MHEVLQEAISAQSLPLTVVLGLIGIYWLVALIGVMDFDALDGVLGLDSDGHADGAADSAEGDSDGHGDGGGFAATVMKIIGATDAPIMFVITLYTLFLWGGSVLGNIYFNADESGARSGLILGVSLAGSFVLTRILIRPLRPLMRLLRDTEKRVPLVGLTGRVRSLTVTESGGQVEVLRDGAPILLHARVAEGREPLPRGAEVLIVLEDEKPVGTYLVRPLSDSDIAGH